MHNCLIRVLMLASLTTAAATDFSKRQMFFEKVPGVLHQSPNSTTLTCSAAGGCSVFDCTKACLQTGECVVCSHNPAAGLCVLGGPVHADLPASDVMDAAWDTYKGRCPVQAGYAEYDYEGGVVCLRVVRKMMTHADAVSTCADHRAGLVMIKDGNYSQFLHQIFVVGPIWVGAERQPTDLQYYWLDGTPVSDDSLHFFAAWRTESCLIFRLRLQMYRKLRYSACQSLAYVICQFFL